MQKHHFTSSIMSEPDTHLAYLQAMYDHLQAILDQFCYAIQNAFLSNDLPSQPHLSMDDFIDLYDSDSLSEGWTIVDN